MCAKSGTDSVDRPGPLAYECTSATAPPHRPHKCTVCSPPLSPLQELAAATPKGQVNVTFPQKGNKAVTAMQGEPIGKVIQRSGLKVKFDCKVPRPRAALRSASIRADAVTKPPAPRACEPSRCPPRKAQHRAPAHAQNGRCGTCQVRLNGRAAVKVCQGPTIPAGATRSLTITLDNL